MSARRATGLVFVIDYDPPEEGATVRPSAFPARVVHVCDGFGLPLLAAVGWSPHAVDRRHVLSSVSPSIASVFALRRRRGAAIDAGSTTWLSMPFASSNRCTQKPSRPASWIITMFTARLVDCAALARRRSNKDSNAGPSPAGDEYFDNFVLPGDNDVTSHIEWLNSSDV